MEQEDFSKYNGEGTTLRKAQLRMLDILVEVDKICKKHNIAYWIDYGTLLGAVRHGGFIPWDDDMDICVFRKDMKKLRKILIKELPDHLVYQDCKNDNNYPLVISKIRELNSILIEEGLTNLTYNGIFIDIMAIEPIPSLKLKRRLDYFYGHIVRGIHNYYNNKPFEKIKCLLSYLPISLIILIVRLVTKFKKNSQYGRIYGWNFYHLLSPSDILPCKPITFEGREFMGVNNPDSYLSKLYGDYMQIPPEDKRQVHALKIEFLDEK